MGSYTTYNFCISLETLISNIMYSTFFLCSLSGLSSREQEKLKNAGSRK